MDLACLSLLISIILAVAPSHMAYHYSTTPIPGQAIIDLMVQCPTPETIPLFDVKDPDASGASADNGNE